MIILWIMFHSLMLMCEYREVDLTQGMLMYISVYILDNESQSLYVYHPAINPYQPGHVTTFEDTWYRTSKTYYRLESISVRIGAWRRSDFLNHISFATFSISGNSERRYHHR
jgi:hypothetical protein